MRIDARASRLTLELALSWPLLLPFVLNAVARPTLRAVEHVDPNTLQRVLGDLTLALGSSAAIAWALAVLLVLRDRRAQSLRTWVGLGAFAAIATRWAFVPRSVEAWSHVDLVTSQPAARMAAAAELALAADAAMWLVAAWAGLCLWRARAL